MLIIPAIDIFDGKCVRLRQGDYTQQTVYSASPEEIARQFVAAAFTFLHVVDLQGAKEKSIVNWKPIESIARVPGLRMEVGGGIRTAGDIKRLLDLGVERVVIGSVAARSPELVEQWIREFGTERIAVGMDARNGKVAVSGWLEESACTPAAFISDLSKRGAKIFICTDISRDGMLAGANIPFFLDLKSAFPEVVIIASGGVTSLSDIRALRSAGLPAAIVGKAIYEGTIRIEELAQMNDIAC